MTLRMTFKTSDFRGVFKEDFEGDFERGLGGGLGGGLGEGLGGGVGGGLQRSGLVQVWFSLQPKFNSFELDSEVGRLVLFTCLLP